MVLQDLKTLNASTVAFAAALIVAAPVSSFLLVDQVIANELLQADLKGTATTIETTILAAFAKAIAAFS